MTSKYAYVYEHLLSLRPDAHRQPTLETVALIQQHLRQGLPLDHTLAQPELANWSTADVTHLITKLGKFVAQTRKNKTDAVTLDWHEAGVMFYAPSQAEVEAERQALLKDRKAGRKGKTTSFLTPDSRLDIPTVFLPPGWTKSDLGKDYGRSIATIALNDLTSDEFTRFIYRHYACADVDLTADHVFLLAWLVNNRQLHRLAELTSKDYPLANALRKAWDLLQTASSDADAALDRLAHADGLNSWETASDLVDDCSRCEWVWPSEVLRVRSAAEAVVDNPDNESARRVLEGRLRSFAAVARFQGISRVTVPDDLLLSHCHSICEYTGLTGHEDAEKQAHSRIKEWLNRNGFTNDRDTEIGEGMRAWRAGLLDEFFENRAARRDGDSNWFENWNAVLAAHS